MLTEDFASSPVELCNISFPFYIINNVYFLLVHAAGCGLYLNALYTHYILNVILLCGSLKTIIVLFLFYISIFKVHTRVPKKHLLVMQSWIIVYIFNQLIVSYIMKTNCQCMRICLNFIVLVCQYLNYHCTLSAGTIP